MTDPLLKLRLFQFPVLHAWAADQDVRMIPRAFDARWLTQEVVRNTSVGFNPFSDCIYISGNGPMARFLEECPGRDVSLLDEERVRRYNDRDAFIGELMFGMHDYMHLICYRWMTEFRDITPYAFGLDPIDEETFEFYVFMHLLSEAFAIVSLDYWFLCNVDYSEQLGIGTMLLKGGITVPYHRRFDPEIRRFWPDFETQSPEYFRVIVDNFFYDTFGKLDNRHMKLSPFIDAWIARELTVSRSQRSATRHWFFALSGRRPALRGCLRSAPRDEPFEPWQSELIDRLADVGWRMFKRGQWDYPRVHYDFERLFTEPEIKDMRFHSAQLVADEAPVVYEGFACRQEVLQREYGHLDDEQLNAVVGALHLGDRRQLRPLLEAAPRLPIQPVPEELFIYLQA